MLNDIQFHSLPTNPKFKDLTDQRFIRWLVLGYAGVSGNISQWWCRCDCGIIKKVFGTHLRTQKSGSCGCLSRENTISRETIHNDSHSVEHIAYRACRGRCNNQNNPRYKDYGGRGIEFRFDSYSSFLAELGRKPSKHHSVDRIDNNGHYEKGNVRWATQKEQNRNTRKNHYLVINGERKCLSEWAEQFGIDEGVIERRINYLKWCNACAVLPKYSRCSHKN